MIPLGIDAIAKEGHKAHQPQQGEHNAFKNELFVVVTVAM
jgi:hypothetical protein